MVVYKFYLRDAIKGDIFLGSLPERRINPRRINEQSTEESILNWGRKYFDTDGKNRDIFFIKTISEESEKHYPNASLP